MDFLIINGEIQRKEEINLTHLFYDELFILSQKMWFGFGGIPLFNKNLDLLTKQIEILQLPFPELFKNRRELFRITKRMLNKNKLYRSGYIHIQLFWSRSKINSVISSISSSEFEFPFYSQGLLINYSDLKKHSENLLNQYPFFNITNWKVITNRLNNSPYHNSILINENSAICECAKANIFMIKNNVLFTPSLETGCFEDNLRNIILEIACSIGLKTIESPKIKREDIIQMDELFLGSEEQGIQRILGVENKRFVYNFSVRIHQELNEYLKGKIKNT